MWIVMPMFRITSKGSFIFKVPTELSSDNSGLPCLFRVMVFLFVFKFSFSFCENTGKPTGICLGTKTKPELFCMFPYSRLH